MGDSIVVGSRDQSVHAYTLEFGNGAPAFALSDRSPERPELLDGESLTMSVTITNTGGRTVTQSVVFRLDSDGIATKRIELADGAATEIACTDARTFIDAREYTIATDDDHRSVHIAVEPADDASADETHRTSPEFPMAPRPLRKRAPDSALEAGWRG